MNDTDKLLFNPSIRALTLDSRQIQPGDIFVALKGTAKDGRAFIPDALARGAKAILYEMEDLDSARLPISTFFSNPSAISTLETQGSQLLIPYSRLRESVGYIAAQFYDQPAKNMKMIGITGTNGKTSCSFFIAQLMTILGVRCGVMGTLGNGFLGELHDRHCTTPDAILTHRELKRMYQSGAEAVVMEVTSHALSQGRINGISFHTTLFTNLTRDHLDYHGNMEAYFSAKKKLFTEFHSEYQVINLDDPASQMIMPLCLNPMGYTLRHPDRFQSQESFPVIRVLQHSQNDEGIEAFLDTPFGKGVLHSSLLGQFNLSNLLAAITTVCLQGFSLEEVLKAVPSIKNAPGRMVRLGGGEIPLVVVDFAHSPDSLKQVLMALRPHCKGKLWCVFGCGGDRDRGKRPEMASVTEQLADHIVVTQDNSRTEAPTQIFQEIRAGFQNPTQIHWELDRAKAIDFAIQSSHSGDIILVAGKGHENTQILGHEKHPFDDQEIIAKILARRHNVLIKQ